ncbi:Thymidylate synthase [Buchnera aphidicola (Eriosoma grossulariae)]|uniref:thymidylate synthase n=1 Tax=Buchnera aphidicola TaxID=9 RepID=UPI0034644DFC
MKKYLTLLKKIIKNGKYKKDRTKTSTFSIFGYNLRFNLNDGFPLLTTKKCHIPSIIHELLWFLKGDTNIKYLNDHNISIWNPWANQLGELGPIYGQQWRKWRSNDGQTIDQIKLAIETIKKQPYSRRIIISSWNVGEIKNMALPPCHVLFQFYVIDQTLSCQVYQRSCDIFLGLPFNIASYSLLIHMMAQQCCLKVGEFLWTGGDIHLYKNHLIPAKIQLQRKPKQLPTLILNNCPNSLFEYEEKNFKIINYYPYPSIKATISI